MEGQRPFNAIPAIEIRGVSIFLFLFSIIRCWVRRERNIFEIRPSRMAKNASPRLKVNKLLYSSKRNVDDSQKNIIDF